MPSLLEAAASSTIKSLHLGPSGTGKTGALASLARAGYNLYILDYDAGLTTTNSLADALKDDHSALARIQFESPRDTVRPGNNGLPLIKPPITAYKSAGKILQTWDVTSFTPRDIIVLDTLTSFSEAAFNEALLLGGRLNQRPQLQDFGWMADSVKLFIEMLTDPSLNCHVIVNTHVRIIGIEEETMVGDNKDRKLTQVQGLPNAKGQEISRIVSRYFNNVLLFRSMGSGPGAKRVISTTPQGVVEVKTSAPTSVKPQYPIETGLAQFFEDVLGRGPPPSSPAVQRQAPEHSDQPA